MVSDPAKAPVAPRRRKWVTVLLLVVGSCLMLSVSLYLFAWPDVRRYFSPSQVASRQRERDCASYRRRVDSTVEAAIDHIQTLGGRVELELQKFNEVVYDIDLSQWRGRDVDLALLLPFRLLADDNRVNDPDRFVTLALDSKATDASLSYVGDLTNLESLSVSGASVTDAGLQHLEKLDQLWSLNLSETQVTDQSIDTLARLKRLRRLDASGTRITADGIDTLARLKRLRRLDVSGTRISADGIAELARLNRRVEILFSGGTVGDRRLGFNAKADQEIIREFVETRYFLSIEAVPNWFGDDDLALVTSQRDLRHLDLSDSQITDAGLRHLSGLTCLGELRLSDVAITGSGFQNVDRLESLSSLQLAFTRVSDMELVHLKKMPTLRELTLTGTAITGDGLQHLSGMESLRQLYLHGTQVPFAELEEWHRANPSVTVRHDQGLLEAETGTKPASSGEVPPPVE